MHEPRISRETLFLQVARVFALRGTCPRAQVGVVIVDNNRIVAHGYNGSPPGQPHCEDVGCGGGVHASEVIGDDNPESLLAENLIYPNGCTRTVHAEANAIVYAARVGSSLEGTTMFSTHEPCIPCAKLIVTAGISAVLYGIPYREPGTPLLRECGVGVRRID